MASFEEIQFPPSISLGATGGPNFSTNVIILSSGYEARNQNWTLARAEYDISTGIKTQSDMDAVIAFFYARAGRAQAFRFKDWKDYQAAAQTLGTADGTHHTYQLVKSYTSGSVTYVRTITKPVAGSVVVYLNGVSTPNFTVDTTTGIVTVTSGDTAGVVVSADCQFDVPVRFDVDKLEVEIQDFATTEFASIVRKIPLIEVRI